MIYAGFWRRAGAWIIDSIIFAIILAILFGNLAVDLDGLSFADILRNVAGLIYSVLFWVHFSGTPGKLLMDCQVVDAKTGNPVSHIQAIIRYLGYYASILSFGIGFLWVIWDKKNQGFHDKIAGTVVQYNGITNTYDESQKSLQQLISEIR